MQTTDVAVIGAGPGGLAAAVRAAQAGLQVTLIDERPAPGGQYLGGLKPPVGHSERKGQALLESLPRSGVDLRSQTLVWELSPGLQLSLFGPEGLDALQARAVIVAGGGRELVLPFPGWTLPGVMTAGAAQLMVKKYGVLPGHRVLLAGSGPLLLPVAVGLAEAGAQIAGVLEAGHPRSWLRYAPAAWGAWDRLQEGWHYLIGLRRARIPYRFGWSVVRALGSDRLEAAVVARLDGAGKPLLGTEKTIQVDTLCLGFGLVPNVELTQIAGCALHHQPQAGGWVPVLDEHLQTSVPGLFVAGETAGIAGAGAAMVEGQMAALKAASRLGHTIGQQLADEMTGLTRARRRMRRFAGVLNTMSTPLPGLDTLATDDTPICRCEEVLAGQLRNAVAQGVRGLDELKTRTRAGQGMCQGRTCGPLVARLVAGETGLGMAQVPGFGVRPPLKPVPLAALAQEALS